MSLHFFKLSLISDRFIALTCLALHLIVVILVLTQWWCCQFLKLARLISLDSWLLMSAQTCVSRPLKDGLMTLAHLWNCFDRQVSWTWCCAWAGLALFPCLLGMMVVSDRCSLPSTQISLPSKVLTQTAYLEPIISCLPICSPLAVVLGLIRVVQFHGSLTLFWHLVPPFTGKVRWCCDFARRIPSKLG